MIKTWLTVTVMIGLIISALFYRHTVFKGGYESGQRDKVLEQTQKENAELKEVIENLGKNHVIAKTYDTENSVRKEKNDAIIVPRALIPNNDRSDELDIQFLETLEKLQ